MNEIITVVNGIHPFYSSTQPIAKKEITSNKLINFHIYSYKDNLPFDLSKIFTSKLVVSSSRRNLIKCKNVFFNDLTDYDQNELLIKRGYIQVNGISIDVTLMGLSKNIHNGSWLLFSNPNAGIYEHLAFKYLSRMHTLSTNILFYNYPGTGNSEGVPSPSTMIATHRAMLNFLENKNEGLGANKIIVWGLSIGGGVQAESMKDHKLDENIKYVIVSEQTFSKLSDVPKRWFSKLNSFMQFIDWEFDTFSSIKNLECAKIIIQKAARRHPSSVKHILDDQVITPENALAYSAIKEKIAHKTIGVSCDHCYQYTEEEWELIDNSIKVYTEPFIPPLHLRGICMKC